MSNTIKKYKMQQVLNANNDTLELHPMTDADIVNYTKTIAGVTVNNVKDALDIISSSAILEVSINTEYYNNENEDVVIPNTIGDQIYTLSFIRFYENAGSKYEDCYYCIASYKPDEDEGESYYTFTNGKDYFKVIYNIDNNTYTLTARKPYIDTMKIVTIDEAVYNFRNASVSIPKTLADKISHDSIIKLINTSSDEPETYNLYYCTGVYVVPNSQINEMELTFTNTYNGTYFIVSKDNASQFGYIFQMSSIVINNLNSNAITFPLSAAMGKKLQDEKQPLLTFDNTPTANSNNPVKSSGVYSAIQNVMEVAEGKTKNYVIDATETGTNIVNTAFNSNLQELRVDYSKNIKVFGHADSVNLFDLKVGDIISITQTNVPDRWLGGFAGGEAIFLSLEIKFDIDTTVTQNSANPVSSGAVYNALLNKQNNIDANNKVSANFITETTDKQFASSTEKTAWNSKYDKPSSGIPSSDLANSGVSAGTYSAVSVNAKGQVTAGGQIVEIGSSNQTTPSSSLVVGGIFFKEI